MMFGAGLELRPMSISELMPMPERARRLEVFTGEGRRRTWPADEKAAIVAESYAPGKTVCGGARRHGVHPAPLVARPRPPPAALVPRPPPRPPLPFIRQTAACPVCACRGRAISRPAAASRIAAP